MAYLNGRRILLLLKPSTLQEKTATPAAVAQPTTEDAGSGGLSSVEVKAASRGDANAH